MRPVACSALQKYGLGYLADKGDSFATLQKLVTAYNSSGGIDNQGLRDSLLSKLQDHDQAAFTQELKAQSQKHISEYAAKTVVLVANALTP